ncbi:hypothetical protein SNEBB_008384 [Seison nebaliae]|nr:hypothetical protein SNEBB_008384 [Seison nebaliae]
MAYLPQPEQRRHNYSTYSAFEHHKNFSHFNKLNEPQLIIYTNHDTSNNPNRNNNNNNLYRNINRNKLEKVYSKRYPSKQSHSKKIASTRKLGNSYRPMRSPIRTIYQRKRSDNSFISSNNSQHNDSSKLQSTPYSIIFRRGHRKHFLNDGDENEVLEGKFIDPLIEVSSTTDTTPTTTTTSSPLSSNGYQTIQLKKSNLINDDNGKVKMKRFPNSGRFNRSNLRKRAQSCYLMNQIENDRYPGTLSHVNETPDNKLRSVDDNYYNTNTYHNNSQPLYKYMSMNTLYYVPPSRHLTNKNNIDKNIIENKRILLKKGHLRKDGINNSLNYVDDQDLFIKNILEDDEGRRRMRSNNYELKKIQGDLNKINDIQEEMKMINLNKSKENSTVNWPSSISSTTHPTTMTSTNASTLTNIDRLINTQLNQNTEDNHKNHYCSHSIRQAGHAMEPKTFKHYDINMKDLTYTSPPKSSMNNSNNNNKDKFNVRSNLPKISMNFPHTTTSRMKTFRRNHFNLNKLQQSSIPQPPPPPPSPPTTTTKPTPITTTIFQNNNVNHPISTSVTSSDYVSKSSVIPTAASKITTIIHPTTMATNSKSTPIVTTAIRKNNIIYSNANSQESSVMEMKENDERKSINFNHHYIKNNNDNPNHHHRILRNKIEQRQQQQQPILETNHQERNNKTEIRQKRDSTGTSGKKVSSIYSDIIRKANRSKNINFVTPKLPLFSVISSGKSQELSDTIKSRNLLRRKDGNSRKSMNVPNFFSNRKKQQLSDISSLQIDGKHRPRNRLTYSNEKKMFVSNYQSNNNNNNQNNIFDNKRLSDGINGHPLTILDTTVPIKKRPITTTITENISLPTTPITERPLETHMKHRSAIITSAKNYQPTMNVITINDVRNVAITTVKEKPNMTDEDYRHFQRVKLNRMIFNYDDKEKEKIPIYPKFANKLHREHYRNGPNLPYIPPNPITEHYNYPKNTYDNKEKKLKLKKDKNVKYLLPDVAISIESDVDTDDEQQSSHYQSNKKRVERNSNSPVVIRNLLT